MKKHTKMDVALVNALGGVDDAETLKNLSVIYGRWSRQIKALIRDRHEHEQWLSERGLSASELRYCELEAIPVAEFIKSKGDDAR